jgi:hypothetical protein
MKRLLWLPVVLHAVPALADETRTVSPFTGVSVGAGVRARVDEGPAGPIRLGGPPEVLAHLKTEVKDGLLVVQFEEGYRGSNRAELTLEARLPRADRLGVSGGARLEASVPAAESLGLAASGGGELRVTRAMSTRKLSIAASGGSRIEAPTIEADDAQLALSGAARVRIAGRAAEGSLAISGSSELDASGFAVGRLVVQGSGGSRAAIRAAEVSAGALSGGSEVRVPANAQVGALNTSGGAQLRRDL